MWLVAILMIANVYCPEITCRYLAGPGSGSETTASGAMLISAAENWPVLDMYHNIWPKLRNVAETYCKHQRLLPTEEPFSEKKKRTQYTVQFMFPPCLIVIFAMLLVWLWNGNVGQSVHHFGTGWNTSTTVGWVAMKFCTYIYGVQRMNLADIGCPLTFPLTWPWCQNFCFLVKCVNN